MKPILIAGIDPAISNTGLVKGYLDIETDKLSITDMRLLETKPGTTKSVRKNSDDLTRARYLKQHIDKFLVDCVMVFVEIPVGSQSARSMCGYGICIGLIASIAIPVIQISPSEIKFTVNGSKQASKSDIIAWAVDRYPNDFWFTSFKQGKTSYLSKNEHLADAIAAIHAGLVTDQYNQAKALFLNT